jgi:AcrR family transcriptional regulator
MRLCAVADGRQPREKFLTEAKKPSGKQRVTKQKVAAAAIQCFKQYGVHRTSMADIADAYGVSRQTLYRQFENRSVLLEYIATQRLDILMANLAKFLARFSRLSEAIVEGMVYSIKLSRADDLLMEIILQEGDEHFTTFQFGGTEQVQKGMLDAWQPLINASREANEIADGVSDAEIIEWLSNVGHFLNVRPDYDEEDHRRILQKFVLPSLRL